MTTFSSSFEQNITTRDENKALKCLPNVKLWCVSPKLDLRIPTSKLSSSEFYFEVLFVMHHWVSIAENLQVNILLTSFSFSAKFCAIFGKFPEEKRNFRLFRYISFQSLTTKWKNQHFFWLDYQLIIQNTHQSCSVYVFRNFVRSF